MCIINISGENMKYKNYNFSTNKYSISQIEKIISNNVLNHNDWFQISLRQSLTETFIEKYKDHIYWNAISSKQKLSEEFIEKYVDKVHWSSISFEQVLSESFIEKYKDRVKWDNIIISQKLSYDFIEKYMYKFSLGLSDLYSSHNKYNRKHIESLKVKYNSKYLIDTLSNDLNNDDTDPFFYV